MGFFSTYALSLIAKDSSRIDDIYAARKSAFISKLGPTFATQPEDHIKLAFCSVLAYELKPYGSSTATSLQDLLAAKSLDCDNYALLAWHLYGILNPDSEALVTMVGWNGSPVVNHAQLMIATPGSKAMVADPTIGHIALTPSFSALAAGQKIPLSHQASFYIPGKSGIDWFKNETVSDLTEGKFGSENLLYTFSSVQDYETYGNSSLNWWTPQAEKVNGTSSRELPIATAYGAPASVTANGVANGFFSKFVLNQILHDPSKIHGAYASLRNKFISKLGDSYRSLPDDYIKLAFASVLAYELKPYGTSTATSLPDLLAANTLNHEGYALLTWYLFRVMAPQRSTDVDMVGWNGGATGTHTQLIIKQPGVEAMTVDPTVAHIAIIGSLDTLTNGNPIDHADQASFYTRGGLNWYRNQAVSALSDGLFRTGNLLYYFDSLESFVANTIPWDHGSTPQGSLLTNKRPESGKDILLSYMPGQGAPSHNNISEKVGTVGADVIRGSSGADILIGGDGNDFLYGYGGANSLDGGYGNDTYVVYSANDKITDAGGKDAVISYISFVLPDEIENLTLKGSAALDGVGNDLANRIVGTAGANRLWGGYGNDTLLGGSGNDSIRGGDGNDHLDGGFGYDVMTGGRGNDTYILNSAGDQVHEKVNEGVDTIYAAFSYQLKPYFENLVLTGRGNIAGSGNSASNIMSGNSSNNLLAGLDGADSVYGGSGLDTLEGGLGYDTLDGGPGGDLMIGDLGNDVYRVDSIWDRIVEAPSEGIDRVESRISFVLTPNLEHLTLLGTGSISGKGNETDNILIGNNGSNRLDGDAGNDVLIGGAGRDILIGGAGLDRFVFKNLTDSGPTFSTRDVISGFIHGDKIDLSAIDADANALGNQSFHFVNAFSGRAGELTTLRTTAAGAHLPAFLLQADVNGDKFSDFSLQIYASPGFDKLYSWDFVL